MYIRVYSPSICVQSRSAFTVSRDTKRVRDIPVPLCFLLAVALFALSCCCAWPLALPALLLLSTAICTASLMGPCFLGRRPAGLGLCSRWKCRCLRACFRPGPALAVARGGCSWLHGHRPRSLPWFGRAPGAVAAVPAQARCGVRGWLAAAAEYHRGPAGLGLQLNYRHMYM